jgi:hypothetical protein
MTADLYTALADANLHLSNPSKDGKGNYGTYLTLGALLDHVRKQLAEHGLSIVQDVVLEGDRVQVVTQLLHCSGQSIVFGPLSGPAGANIQQLGSAITYLRRYSLTAVLGIAGDDDDDGTQAAQSPMKKVTHGGPLGRDEATRRATDKQIAFIVTLMKAQGLNEVALNTLSEAELGFSMSVGGLAKLTAHEASALIERMKDPGKVTRYTPKDDDEIRMWDTPLVDPFTGEVAK